MEKVKAFLVFLLFDALFIVVVFLFFATLIGMGGNKAALAEQNEIWENGSAVTGTIIKSDQPEKLYAPPILQHALLQYEVDGVAYEEECSVKEADFEKLDGEDKDGKASIELRYDPKDPSRVAAEQTVEAARAHKRGYILFAWIYGVLAVIGLIVSFILIANLHNKMTGGV